MVLEEMHTVYRPWARYHQARGVCYPYSQRLNNSFVNRASHPKIISVDDKGRSSSGYPSKWFVCHRFILIVGDLLIALDYNSLKLGSRVGRIGLEPTISSV
jgi:hypothetical protein